MKAKSVKLIKFDDSDTNEIDWLTINTYYPKCNANVNS